MQVANSQQINRSLHRISLQILERCSCTPVLIGIKKRGLPLAARIRNMLQEELSEQVLLGSLDISLYQKDIKLAGHGPVIHDLDIPFSIRDREIIIIDDVLITGYTAHAALDAILDHGRPAGVLFACLIDVRQRQLPLYSDFTGYKVSLQKDEKLALKVAEIDGSDEISVQKAD